jgi:hypothetical protein
MGLVIGRILEGCVCCVTKCGLVFGFKFVQVVELGLGWGSIIIPSDHVSAFVQLCIEWFFDAASCEKDRCLQNLTMCVTENL